MNFFNPKTIIIAGLLCFAVALVSYIYRLPGVVNNWFPQLPLYGQIAVVGFCICLVWLFVSQTLIKKRNK